MKLNNEYYKDNSNRNRYRTKTINNNMKNSQEEKIFPRYQLSKKEFLNYMEKSPDEMTFEEALKKDKRKFCTIYLNYLINNHEILNIIFIDDKFRSKLFKIIIHILSIDLYLVINGLFFSEEYIDELYLSQKEEKFFMFIQRSFDRIIYASVVSVIVKFILNCILISEEKIKSTLIREKDDITIMKGEIGKILFQMEGHIKCFLIINYLLMIFSWYYICCFNHAYSYTKKEWIKSSILIIILQEVFPFLLYIIIALLRILSLSWKSEQIFKISSSL